MERRRYLACSHMLLMVGAPRIDTVVVPREKEDDTLGVDACFEDGTALPQEEVAGLLAVFGIAP